MINFTSFSYGLVVQDEYPFKSGTKLRTHISCSPAIFVLFTCTSIGQGEYVKGARGLRCYLIAMAVSTALVHVNIWNLYIES